MKKIKTISIIILLCVAGAAFSQDGETLFKTTCTACHTVGKGKLVGPDLKGVNKKYPEKWLLDWIRSSQTMVQKGDAKAKKIFEENLQVVMPDNNLTDTEIKAVLAYIKSQSTETVKPVQSTKPKSSTGTNISNQSPPDITAQQMDSNEVTSNENASVQLNDDSLNSSTTITQSGSESPDVQPISSNKTESPVKTAESTGFGNIFSYIGLSALLLLLIATIIVLSRTAAVLKKTLR